MLAGPSELPDPRFHAYRKDLADIALAGRVIASHFAAPLACRLARSEPLRPEPDEQSESLCTLEAGAAFEILDNSLGWAWGYAGAERRVGYVRSDALG